MKLETHGVQIWHASCTGCAAPTTLLCLPHAADPTSCLLTDARLLSIATVFGLSIGALVYATASFSGATFYKP